MIVEQDITGEAKVPDYGVIVVGAGAVYDEKIRGALDRLGPVDKRVLIDWESKRIGQEKSTESVNTTGAARPSFVIADSRRAPFNIDQLSESKRKEFVVFVAVPDHLGTIKSFVAGGFRRFIVEKPMVNNGKEVAALEGLKKDHPDLLVYPLDFYVQKVAPLLLLTGRIKTTDPRWEWVTTGDGQPVARELAGALSQKIGELEGIEVIVLEGGNLGLPDLAKREWLEKDEVRGGMLLDLGTHALAPLVAAGLLSAETTEIVQASRCVFGSDRKSYVPALPGQPEMYARALLTSYQSGRSLPLALTVGKTFHDGGMWSLTLRGSRGYIFMGLRTGDSLMVIPKEGDGIRLKLKAGSDPYALACQEADMYFQRPSNFDGNMQAMLDAIAIIDQIKQATFPVSLPQISA